jgi:hypothetical protein
VRSERSDLAAGGEGGRHLRARGAAASEQCAPTRDAQLRTASDTRPLGMPRTAGSRRVPKAPMHPFSQFLTLPFGRKARSRVLNVDVLGPADGVCLHS